MRFTDHCNSQSDTAIEEMIKSCVHVHYKNIKKPQRKDMVRYNLSVSHVTTINGKA